MAPRPVPVTMDSTRFEAQPLPGCLVTVAWFPPGAVLEPHVHDRPTFATMLDGAFDVVFPRAGIRNSRLPCTPGTVFSEPAGEQHANYVGAAGARVVVLQPDLGDPHLPRRCVRFLDRINHFRDGPIVFGARRLARELAAPDDMTPLATEGIALEMLASAGRLDEEECLQSDTPPPWLARGLEYIHDRFREKVQINDVAQAAGVHPAHLAAVFRRVHRVSLGTYLRRLRVEWAGERLLRSTVPISVVAAEAGFADQAHFTRLFKRTTGWTPAAYRRAKRR